MKINRHINYRDNFAKASGHYIICNVRGQLSLHEVSWRKRRQRAFGGAAVCMKGRRACGASEEGERLGPVLGGGDKREISASSLLPRAGGAVLNERRLINGGEYRKRAE